jgi:nicotinamidase-related amidase
MSSVTIDARPALVMIDLQKGILGLPTLVSRGDIKDRARQLAAAFRANALPVVRVKVAWSPDGGDLPPGRALMPGPGTVPPAGYSEFPEDFPPEPGDLVVVKRHWEHSYNLIFVEDAITDVDAASHAHTFGKIFPHLGEIATTEQLVGTLISRSASRTGRYPSSVHRPGSENAGL